MQLVRFIPTEGGPARPGVLAAGVVHDLGERFATLAAFLAEHPDGWGRDTPALVGLPTRPLAEVRLAPPVDDGATVYAVGANYRKHAEEAGLSVPSQPVIFMKPTTALVGPGEAIVIPPVTRQLDYEGELAVVIGRAATRVTKDEAPRHVAGVTILNDTTARDLQWVELGKNRIVDWFASKGLDRSSPLGPAITSIAEIADPHALRLTTHLNGEPMQDADTSLMVFSVWELIEFVSARATLRPGDVLSTGTPFGVGGFREIFLKPGDTVRVEIAGIGVLENPVAEG